MSKRSPRNAAVELSHFGRAVVFSVHSVEQIPQLPDELIPFVAGVADEVTVLHFEPVGWQIVGGDDSYAVRHDYNRNPVPLLRAHETVRVLDEQVDVRALTAENPTSLLKWEPHTGAVSWRLPNADRQDVVYAGAARAVRPR